MAITPLPGFPTRVATHLGRRGTVLVCVGVIWAAYGTSIVGDNIERFSRPGGEQLAHPRAERLARPSVGRFWWPGAGRFARPGGERLARRGA